MVVVSPDRYWASSGRPLDSEVHHHEAFSTAMTRVFRPTVREDVVMEQKDTPLERVSRLYLVRYHLRGIDGAIGIRKSPFGSS